MGSIKYRRRNDAPSFTSTATADDLNRLFLIRLQSERVHFVTLSAALARAEECPGRIFDDLNFRAHRLQGAAATFDFPDLAKAASMLEMTSLVAATAHAEHTDSSVWKAVVALVELLGDLDGSPLAARETDTVQPTG